MSTRELLKQAVLGLNTLSTIRIPSSSKASTVVQYFREQSLAAPHSLLLTESLVYKEVLSLVKNSSVQITGVDIGYDKIASAVSKQLLIDITHVAATYKGTKNISVSVVNNVLTVAGANNNFQIIRQIVNTATNTVAYKLESYLESVLKTFDSNASVTTVGKIKFGFDLGHLHANIASAVETAMFNTLSRSAESRHLVGKNDPTVNVDIEKLKRALNDPNVIKAILGKSSPNLESDVLQASTTIVLDYIRSFNEGKIRAVLTTEPKLDRTVINRVAKQLTVNLFLQDAGVNQQDGATIEKKIASQLVRITNNNLKQVLSLLANSDKYNDIVNLEGSPSIKQDVQEDLFLLLQHGKAVKKARKSSATAKSKKKAAATAKTPARKGKNVKSPSTIKMRVPPLRNIKGQFMSILTLQAILENLPEKVEDNMGNGSATDRLNLQTGRFASSVEATKVMSTREGAIQVFYTYQKYPYQTFEPGYKQGNLGRDPRTLIEGSIRELLQPYVRNAIMTIRE